MDVEHGQPARGRDRLPRKFTYMSHEITVHEPGEPSMPTLSVDGDDIAVHREETGGYSAPMLNMFGTYPTLEDLARSLIDSSPVFLAKRKKLPTKGRM